jgi:hypothetical protein
MSYKYTDCHLDMVFALTNPIGHAGTPNVLRERTLPG